MLAQHGWIDQLFSLKILVNGIDTIENIDKNFFLSQNMKKNDSKPELIASIFLFIYRYIGHYSVSIPHSRQFIGIIGRHAEFETRFPFEKQ